MLFDYLITVHPHPKIFFLFNVLQPAFQQYILWSFILRMGETDDLLKTECFEPKLQRGSGTFVAYPRPQNRLLNK